jgi:NAD(P)-dependent dehydrogenase (short-subunit alcohol dehydrogenase family)
VAWVTGGAQGIGLAVALRLAEDGWAVAINDIDEAKLKSAEKELAAKAKGRSLAMKADISVKAEVDRAAAEIKRRIGPIYALVNNAFWVQRGGILDTTEEVWHRTIEVGLSGYFYCTQAAAPQMIEQKGGSIVNMSAGIADRGIPSTMAYAASKGGVNALSRSTAVELARYGIRSNLVTIGPVRTAAFDTMADTPEQVAARINRVPLGRLGTPEDCAAMVAFLVSEQATWITGGLFHVDGGANNAMLVLSVPK